MGFDKSSMKVINNKIEHKEGEPTVELTENDSEENNEEGEEEVKTNNDQIARAPHAQNHQKFVDFS